VELKQRSPGFFAFWFALLESNQLLMMFQGSTDVVSKSSITPA